MPSKRRLPSCTFTFVCAVQVAEGINPDGIFINRSLEIRACHPVEDARYQIDFSNMQVR